MAYVTLIVMFVSKIISFCDAVLTYRCIQSWLFSSDTFARSH